MEISFDIFLFLGMMMKSNIWSHIGCIDYMGLILSLWTLELNGHAYSTKNRPFCAFTYEKGNSIFIIIVLLFIFFCILSHCSKLYREVQPLNWKYGTVQMLLNRPARFMKLFNLAIENMERFKYVQDCSKYTTKEKKKIDDDKNGFALFTISK